MKRMQFSSKSDFIGDLPGATRTAAFHAHILL
jgi:hypothetical protein